MKSFNEVVKEFWSSNEGVVKHNKNVDSETKLYAGQDVHDLFSAIAVNDNFYSIEVRTALITKYGAMRLTYNSFRISRWLDEFILGSGTSYDLRMLIQDAKYVMVAVSVGDWIDIMFTDSTGDNLIFTMCVPA